jgi:hypothetical protein
VPLEHIFSADAAKHFQHGAAAPTAAAAAAGQGGAEPWGVGWQVNEQKLLWNDDIKMRFVKVSSSNSSCELQATQLLQAITIQYSLQPFLQARQAVAACCHARCCAWTGL